MDELVPEKAQKYTSKKVRVGNKNNKRGGNFGNKRRNEEQEKMRRLQLEIAKIEAFPRMEGRQMLGQIQADVGVAALFRGGLPEQRLGRMGNASGGQAVLAQTNTGQHALDIGAAGAQGIDHRAHQRHVIGQIMHGMAFLL